MNWIKMELIPVITEHDLPFQDESLFVSLQNCPKQIGHHQGQYGHALLKDRLRKEVAYRIKKEVDKEDPQDYPGDLRRYDLLEVAAFDQENEDQEEGHEEGDTLKEQDLVVLVISATPNYIFGYPPHDHRGVEDDEG